jgi:hypothetical protein
LKAHNFANVLTVGHSRAISDKIFWNTSRGTATSDDSRIAVRLPTGGRFLRR